MLTSAVKHAGNTFSHWLAGFSPGGVSATPKVKVATTRRTGRRVCVRGSLRTAFR